MITRELTTMLKCPTCAQGDLQVNIREERDGRILEAELLHPGCGRAYAVSGGVPDLIPNEAIDSGEWKTWKEHLAFFEQRRQTRRRQGDQGVAKALNKANIFDDFVEFARIERGPVLDVGCGSGNLRKYLGSPSIQYVGSDPIPTEQADEFPYVRSLAEYLPFKDGTFSDVVVLSALDHFKDIGKFFEEVSRVLDAGGRFHLVQSIHGGADARSVVKSLTHWAKDTLDDLIAKPSEVKAAPKHMNEFSKSALHELIRRHFNIVASHQHSDGWYRPDKLLLTMSPIAP